MSSGPTNGEPRHVHGAHPGSDLPIRRRDEESDWHNLLHASCETCGCTFYFAQDDPDIVWDPGAAWDEGCRDRECACHTSPVVGTRRSGASL